VWTNILTGAVTQKSQALLNRPGFRMSPNLRKAMRPLLAVGRPENRTKVGSITAEWEYFFNWLRAEDTKEKINREEIMRIVLEQLAKPLLAFKF
jgi:hypothetical protein